MAKKPERRPIVAKKVTASRTPPAPPTPPALTAESVGQAVADVVAPLLTSLGENMTRLTTAVQQGQTGSPARSPAIDATRNQPSSLERILKGTIALLGVLFLFLVIHHIQGCSQNGDILKGVGNLQASHRASEAATEERHQEVLEAIQSRPASDLPSAVVDDTPKVSKIPSSPPPEEAKERKETEASPPEVTVSRPPAPPPAYTVPEKSGLAGSGREVGVFRPRPDQCRDRKPLVVEHHHHHHYTGEILVVVEDRRSP